ncbi:ABC transporter permease [Paracoccus sp. WLY502]|nr:ABC transporter permease [Paracoccus sp. WLY502]MDQ1900550.1 ABC transporter permease [Paracoccus sp. WLY502]
MSDATPQKRPGLVPGILSVLMLLALWMAVAGLADDPRTMPSPLAVAARIVDLAVTGELWLHAGATLLRVLASFAIAMALGIALGLWMGRSQRADHWLNPALVIALNIPTLVVIVLAYIWIGLNEVAAVTAVALNKIPLVTVMLREGGRALRPDLDDMARVFGMGWWSRLRHVVLPQLAPHIAAAARAGISLIWKIVLVVEFLGRSNGVGFKIHLLFSSFDVAGVLAWALAFVAVMLLIDIAILRPWEAGANRWRRDEA